MEIDFTTVIVCILTQIQNLSDQKRKEMEIDFTSVIICILTDLQSASFTGEVTFTLEASRQTSAQTQISTSQRPIKSRGTVSRENLSIISNRGRPFSGVKVTLM